MQLSRFGFLVLLAIASWAGGCKETSQKTATSATTERFTARGKIVRLSPDNADIHHERMPAVRAFDGSIKPMDSMTMPFARGQASFAGLAVGDIVEFEFTVHYDSDPTLRLTRISKLPPETKLDLQ